MFGLSEFLVFIITFLLIKFALCRKRKNVKCFPPGPKGLPILGNIYQLLKDPHLQFSKWAKQYGNLYTISLAGKKAVVASDIETMKTLFGSLSATGKFEFELLDLLYEGPHGIGNAEGHVWLEQQKFAVKALKKFGLGSGSKLDTLILAECDNLCNSFQNKIGTSECSANVGNLRKEIMQITGSLIWSMVTGERLQSGEHSPMAEIVLEWIAAFNRAAKSGLAFFSALNFLAPEWSGYKYFVQCNGKIQKLTKTYFEKHQKTRIPGHEPRDVIDEYIDKMKICEDSNSSFYGDEGQLHSFGSVVGLLLAGTESTATTLHWGLIYLAVHPQIQKKLQREIAEIIGKEVKPSLKDKPRMPYLEAFVLELLRFSSIAPFGIFHKLLDAVTINGYNIPKGTIIVSNIYHANRDVDAWHDPENFRPERFLEGDENQRRAAKELIASFQEGRRKCPGAPLAKDVLFLFTAKLVQKFEFEMQAGRSKEEYMSAVMGYFLDPPELPLVVQRRKD